MATGANTYGTVARVEARIGDAIEGRRFSASTMPTRAQVEALLDDIAAQMNARLKANGFSVPASSEADPEAFEWLRAANSDEAAVRILAQWYPGEAFSPENPDVFSGRARGMRQNFSEAMRAIDEGWLPASRSVTAEVPKAFSGSQQDADGNTKKPLFTRTLHDFPGTRNLVEDE
ncbi:MAG: hypothetical protein L0177_11850 [Chloroflexi bacterium]|nr:hypothetical protein [Chloroflexota bacterium]